MNIIELIQTDEVQEALNNGDVVVIARVDSCVEMCSWLYLDEEGVLAWDTGEDYAVAPLEECRVLGVFPAEMMKSVRITSCRCYVDWGDGVTSFWYDGAVYVAENKEQAGELMEVGE